MFIDQIQAGEDFPRRRSRRASASEKSNTPPPSSKPPERAVFAQSRGVSCKPDKKDDDESLWITYLRRSSKDDDEMEEHNSQEVHVILLGEHSSTLAIGRLITSGPHNTSAEPTGMLLNYAFRRSNNEYDLHIWHLHDETKDDLLKCVIPKDAHVVFIVCIDLSRGEQVEATGLKWTTFLRRAFPDMYPTEEKKPAFSIESFATGEKSETSTSAPDEPNSEGEEALKDMEIDREDPPVPLRPLIFFGHGARACGSEDLFVQLTGEVRRISIENRGSVFVTAKVGDSDVAKNLRLHIRNLTKPGQSLDESLNVSTPGLDCLLEQPYFIDALSDTHSKLVPKPFPAPLLSKRRSKRPVSVNALKDDNFLAFMKQILHQENLQKGSTALPGCGTGLRQSLRSRPTKKKTGLSSPRRSALPRKPTGTGSLHEQGGQVNRKKVNEFFEKLLKAEK